MENKNLTKEEREDKPLLQNWEKTILEELNKKEQREVNKNENKSS